MSDVRRWVVPGRVNLIGEHLDYNGGPVLPMAIDKYLTVKARPRDDHQIHAWSALGAKAELDTAVEPGQIDGWAVGVAAAVWAARSAGISTGADLVIESELPAGAGLSSSAALTVGVINALADLSGTSIDPAEAARLARLAETDFVGVPVGIMDPLSVALGGAQLIDTRTGGTTEVPIDWQGLSLAVIDTRASHSLAQSEYGKRHAECAEAAKILGLDHLAAAGPDAVLKFDDTDPLKKRVRHVMTETTRVRGAVRALSAGDVRQFGMILTSSHESLRDDFEVSCGELDVAVEAALEAGALGARMTGGGFGGSAIALAPTDSLLTLREKVVAAFDHHGWASPTLFTVRPSPGATSAGATLDG